MPNVTNRRTGEFLRKVVEFLINKPNGEQPKNIFKMIAETIELTEYEKGYFNTAGDSPRFIRLIRFGSINLV